MKVSDYSNAQRAIIDKAMSFLKEGQGGRDNTANTIFASVSERNDDSVSGIYDWRAGDDLFQDE